MKIKRLLSVINLQVCGVIKTRFRSKTGQRKST